MSRLYCFSIFFVLFLLNGAYGAAEQDDPFVGFSLGQIDEVPEPGVFLERETDAPIQPPHQETVKIILEIPESHYAYQPGSVFGLPIVIVPHGQVVPIPGEDLMENWPQKGRFVEIREVIPPPAQRKVHEDGTVDMVMHGRVVYHVDFSVEEGFDPSEMALFDVRVQICSEKTGTCYPPEIFTLPSSFQDQSHPSTMEADEALEMGGVSVSFSPTSLDRVIAGSVLTFNVMIEAPPGKVIALPGDRTEARAPYREGVSFGASNHEGVHNSAVEWIDASLISTMSDGALHYEVRTRIRLPQNISHGTPFFQAAYRLCNETELLDDGSTSICSDVQRTPIRPEVGCFVPIPYISTPSILPNLSENRRVTIPLSVHIPPHHPFFSHASALRFQRADSPRTFDTGFSIYKAKFDDESLVEDPFKHKVVTYNVDFQFEKDVALTAVLDGLDINFAHDPSISGRDIQPRPCIEANNCTVCQATESIFVQAIPFGIQFGSSIGIDSDGFFDWIMSAVSNPEEALASFIKNPLMMVPILLILGFIAFFSPCVLPLVPLTISYIGSNSTSTLSGFINSTIYVLGIAFVYVSLSFISHYVFDMAVGKIGTMWYVLIPLVFFFIYLALCMFGFYEFQMPSSLMKGKDKAHEKRNSPLGMFAFGMMAGIVASPCTGPVVLMLLAFLPAAAGVAPDPMVSEILASGTEAGTGVETAAETEAETAAETEAETETGTSLGFGTLAFYLFSFTIGMGFPLMLLGTFSSLQRLLPREGAWMLRVNYFFGSIMILAIYYFLGLLLSSFGASDLAKLLIFLGILSLVAGNYMGPILKLRAMISFNTTKLRRILGIFLMIVSLFFFYGGIHVWGSDENAHFDHEGIESGAKDILPGHDNALWIAPLSVEDHGGMRDIELIVSRASQNGHKVLIDFWAPWCVTCNEFSDAMHDDPSYREAFRDVVIVIVDYDKVKAVEKEAIAKNFTLPGDPIFKIFPVPGLPSFFIVNHQDDLKSKTKLGASRFGYSSKTGTLERAQELLAHEARDESLALALPSCCP